MSIKGDGTGADGGQGGERHGTPWAARGGGNCTDLP